MTEENPMEEGLQLPEQIDYANESDLPKPVKFATTRKAGYVEEEVDKWMSDTVSSISNFLNNYNDVVYKYMTLFAIHKSLKKDVDEMVSNAVLAALEEASNNAPAGSDAPAVDVAALRASITAEVDGQYQAGIADLHAQYADREQQITSHYEGQLADAANQTPVEPVAQETPAGYNARVFTEAAEQARLHVEQTEARMTAIENEAREEAERQIADALQRGVVILENAKNEATKYVDEANLAIDQKNSAIEERNEIFARLRLLYASQISSIDEEEASLGYSPILTEDTVVSFDIDEEVTPEEAPDTVDETVDTEETDVENVTTVEDVVVETVESEGNVEVTTEAITIVEDETLETVEPTDENVADTEHVTVEHPDYDSLVAEALREETDNVTFIESFEPVGEETVTVTNPELGVEAPNETSEGEDNYSGYVDLNKSSEEDTH